MVTHEQAREIVAGELRQWCGDPEDPGVIVGIEDRDACYVVYYTLVSARATGEVVLVRLRGIVCR